MSIVKHSQVNLTPYTRQRAVEEDLQLPCITRFNSLALGDNEGSSFAKDGVTLTAEGSQRKHMLIYTFILI